MMVGHPAVLFAGRYQFYPRQHKTFPRVGSRMVLRLLSGRGAITVDGQALDLQPDRIWLLPWNHAITYQAAAKQPMHTLSVHLVPDWSGTDGPFQVQHDAEPLPEDRADADLGLPAGLLELNCPPDHPLQCLCQHVCESFVLGWDDAAARASAVLLVRSLRATIAAQDVFQGAPLPLRRFAHAVADRMGSRLSIAGLAGIAGVSPATLNRLCLARWGTSPLRYITKQRLDAAARLLSTSDQPVTEIAATVGFTDASWFGRCFARRFGQTPAQWRRQRRP